MSDEQWRPVPEYRLLGVPPGYEASSLGRARSVPRTLSDGRAAGGVVLKPQTDKDGYRTYMLGRRRVRACIVVALAFHGRPEVMHLNDVRDDDRPGNLAWGSHWLNMQGVKRETERKSVYGESLPSVIETPETESPC